MPTDLGMSSTLNSDYMPYMKEPSLHLSDEPFLPVIAALLSPRPPLNNKPLIHNGLAVFYAFFPKIPKFRGKIGEKIRVFSNLIVQIRFDSFTKSNC